MESARVASGGVAVGLSTAIDTIPTWTLVVVLLVVCCGPELRRIAETASNIAWRWRRGGHGDATQDCA